MRPLEIFLSLANLLTLSLAAIPRTNTTHWMRHSIPAVLLIAVAQRMLEGPRWQMVPAYTLTGIFFLVWLRGNIGPASELPHGKPTCRLAIGLGLLWLAISIALPISLPVFRFPQPGGSYAIGTMTYHWADADRPEVFGAAPNALRELMVQVWYPAKQGSPSPHAPYLQNADAVSVAQARLHNLPEFTFGHLKYVTTNANPSALVSDANPSYPVLIFLEAITGYRQMNTFQVEELVSHGYIVVAIDQPYAAAAVVFPDGRQVAGLSKDQMNALIQQSVNPIEQAPILNGRAFKDGIIPYLAQDAIFTLDQLTALNHADPNGILTGRLDLQRVGTFGVSLGGIVVGEVCRLEPRFRACLVMDAPMPADVVAAGLRQPAMWITRDADTMQSEGWSRADIDQHQTTMRAVFEGLRGDGYFVRVPGMFHSNLTDVPYFSPLASQLGLAGPIDEQRAYGIINAYSLAFFDRHLKGHPTNLLDRPTQYYPDVLFESR